MSVIISHSSSDEDRFPQRVVPRCCESSCSSDANYKITSLPFQAIGILLALCLFFAFENVHAHADGENYIWMEVETDRITGRFELNVKDISSKLFIELDPEDTSAESLQKIAEVQSYLRRSFVLLDGTCLLYTSPSPRDRG